MYLIGDWELRKKENWRIMLATRPMVNLYILAYAFALFIVIVWIAAVGGFKKRSDVTE